MGTGGNELPLGRELRMTLPQSEETVASEGSKSAQPSEPQSSTTSGGSVRTPPVSLDKGANKPTKSEQKAASKAVRKEKAREKNITEEKKPQRETLNATAEALKDPQTVKVSIHFVCIREFHHNLCLPRLWKSRNRGTL